MSKRNVLFFIFAIFALVILAGCETATVDVNPNSAEDIVQVDSGTSPYLPDVVEETSGSCGNEDVQVDSGLEVTESQCSSDEDCTEMGACFIGSCRWGNCVYEDKKFCEKPGTACYESEAGNPACAYTCSVDSDCDAHNVNSCLDSICENNFCQYPQDDTNVCDDGDPCTTDDSCFDGACNGLPIDCPNGCVNGECVGCQTWSDCIDGSACTQDVCNPDGSCSNPLWPDAVGSQCDDMHVCMPDGSCSPVECINDSDCIQGDCTLETCIDNQCVYTDICGVDCSTDFDCNDFNPCTDDLCGLDDQCSNPVIPGAIGVPCGDLHICQPDGACAPVDCIIDLDCNDEDPCTVDTCSENSCSHVDQCFYSTGDFHSLVCETDADCAGSPFGDFCYDSLASSQGTGVESLLICQPCTSYGLAGGCDEGQTCTWGGANAPEGFWVDHYSCVDIVCNDDAGCDDGDPCTRDRCHVTHCSNYEKDHCFYCDSNEDCESNSWCNEQSGGVFLEYPVCQPDGTCQVDYWSATIDLSVYGCSYPLNCESDSDCPLGGSCMISTCVYYNTSDEFQYPECNDDSQCELGDCNFETGQCEDWECYGIDNGDGTFQVELCPIGYGCIDHHCTDEFGAVTCSNNADCVVAGLGNYCVANLVTGENECSPCNPESDTGEGFDHGCNSGTPWCLWLDDEVGYECSVEMECSIDDDCGPWEQCQAGECVGYGPIYCQFECPTGDIDWEEVVIWHGLYGDSEESYIDCGSSFTITQTSLCLWGEAHPVAKFNLNAGWDWGGGTDTILDCNYPVTITPDTELGDQGVAVMTFPSFDCDEY